MLFYITFYVLAAILLFQGAQLLGELAGHPLNAVPAEVKPTSPLASRWGGLLVAYGIAMAAVGLLSHAYEWLHGALTLLRGVAVGLEVVYGLWLVFGRKVEYVPAPVTSDEAHGHH